MSRKRNRRQDRDRMHLERLERQKTRLQKKMGVGEDTQPQQRAQVTNFRPRTQGQREYIQAIAENKLVICLGPAGSGKTAVAAYMAAKALKSGDVERIVCVRPAVEAGDTFGKNTLGYLPGGKDEKLAPYLRPLLTRIRKFFAPAEFDRLRRGEFPAIELYPLEHVRGDDFENCFVILDEAQNCTHAQLKMFLTRIAEGTVFVVNGDETQCDLPPEKAGGLEHYARTLDGIDGVAVVQMTQADIVRSEFLRRLMGRM